MKQSAATTKMALSHTKNTLKQIYGEIKNQVVYKHLDAVSVIVDLAFMSVKLPPDFTCVRLVL